jgi:hypothetical protein
MNRIENKRPSTRRYPRWVRSGQSELFYTHAREWIFEIRSSPPHMRGRYRAVCGGEYVCDFSFTTCDEAKAYCEVKYYKDHARPKFVFPRTAIPRAISGTQKVSLPCPVLKGTEYHGSLSVRWNPRYATVRWDYGNFDAYYPQCDKFDELLDQTNWDRELIRRLIDAGWRWQQIDRTCMRWNHLRSVPHDIAQWVMDTLPGVYRQASSLFNSDTEGVSNSVRSKIREDQSKTSPV